MSQQFNKRNNLRMSQANQISMMSIARKPSLKLLCRKVHAFHVMNRTTATCFSDYHTPSKILTDLAHLGA